MKSWRRQKKELEETIAIVGTVAAYKRIHKDLPVKYWPQKLIDYHKEQLHEEMLREIPSTAEAARKARLDELKRGEIRPKRRKYERF